MMQDGLHVGLAAWIGAQRAIDDFVTWPATPFAYDPVDLTTVETMLDLEVASEFARMVNFVPRKGRYAEPFSAVVLWELYRQMLGSMTFAVRPWTKREDDAWNRARALLYEGPHGQEVLTRDFQMYEEYRLAYAELEASGADSGTLSVAAADWIAKGHKVAIESALSTLKSLAQRSSQPEASTQYHELDPTALLSAASGSYAPTGFSPLSASATDTWLLAEASVDDLNLAVGDAGPRAKWDAWRAARSGRVRFRYAALDIHRPWFMPGLLEADDWQITSAASVSEGNSVDGRLPAYVTTIYLVVVEDVRQPPRPRDPPSGGGSYNPGPIDPTKLKSGPSRGVRQRSKPPSPAVGVVAPSRRRTQQLPASTKPLVAMRYLPASRSGPATRGSSAFAPRPTAEVLRARVSLQQLIYSRPARYGRIRRITESDVATRIELASRRSQSNDSPAEAPAATGSSTAYVAGFGCTSVPAAPAPNPDYQWQLK
ncbi:hypothetical protein ACFWPH_32735 [Nocardia sp. NPDC058499]|uniref:hypothetical protein n=1 Tax=Nocardia sp. NPDC058499 TaxID=3346530 RepID=UPI0036611C27